jgi:hypothetical protein
MGSQVGISMPFGTQRSGKLSLDANKIPLDGSQDTVHHLRL